MTTDNRAAMWQLSPIALQILHYLDDGDDAHAFLQAAPDGSLDDALDALRTLLAMDLELPLWPTPHIASLDAAYSINPSVVTKALPLFKKVQLGYCRDAAASICHATELPPTTAVSADVQQNAISVRAALGNWLPNLVNLEVLSSYGNALDFASIAEHDLSECHRLRTLTLSQYKRLDQGTFDHALKTVVATCPQVERFFFGSCSLMCMSDCTALLAWLALPTARHLKLDRTDFENELGAELATGMLMSSTLETIELFEIPSFTRTFLSPSSPPLPPQLRHLTICDYMMCDGYYSIEEQENAITDPPPAFDEADVAALAAKIATASRLESLDLWPRTSCDATAVVSVLPQLPTLTKLALQEVHLTTFPHLVQLLHLDLSSSTFSDEAIESLATLLCSSPKLKHLDLGCDQLPDHQAKTVLRALPQWLSCRGTACDVYLAIQSDVCVGAFTTALALTRNSHAVNIILYALRLSLETKTKLVAALRSTSGHHVTFFSPSRRKRAPLPLPQRSRIPAVRTRSRFRSIPTVSLSKARRNWLQYWRRR
ncbi:hypothetical protein SDRG_02233 [Saprolegnia diclina VS20]|uniref:F-box domain-containing protein n=1 Tax=Saprolegnia diclina (strain VS20) TaxID=1156394 RepID=T0SC16_SAPDV|nr:hypothetical protein SDRG_02233 [Saprolegnia diclina VS20]EQC40332.1 hypothetical protein SDRG_02233 [Saprolegnia diclina VS20]|eukprot:XP_008606031.1 hypothetical protein SDRG_02233 [Saprolegnia diclina VS20]